MNDFETYLSLSAGSTLTIEDASVILDRMNKCVAAIKAEDKMEFYNEMLQNAFTYTSIRCSWELMTREKRIEQDDYRTSCHNAFITSLKILSRLAASEGVDASWLDDLGDERKRIGDFACYLTYITGICNR